MTSPTNQITQTFLGDSLFFTGAATSSEVPGLFPVALAGHPYIVDLKERYTQTFYTKSSIQLNRDTNDLTNLPGEQTLATEDLWRRSEESWHLGAGQSVFDRINVSDPNRFHTSKGVNPWRRWQLTLQNDTVLAKASTNTNLAMVVANGTLYFNDASLVGQVTAPLTTPWAVMNTTGFSGTVNSITTNGTDVWLANFDAGGHGGIWHLTTPGTMFALWGNEANTAHYDLIRYVNGRLIVADNSSASAGLLYDLSAKSAATATPVAFNAGAILPNSPTWVDFAEANGFIVGALVAGDKSTLWSITNQPQGAALASPVLSATLPSGETVLSIVGYLGYIVVGSTLGTRFCTIDGTGAITLGPLLPTGPCRAFLPFDRFVWFGWENYDANSTGTGRLDLSAFTGPATPAYASDVMAGHPQHTGGAIVTAQGQVSSIVNPSPTVTESTPDNLPFAVPNIIFAVSNAGAGATNTGFYVTNTNTVVPNGTFMSGLFTYGILDNKIGMYLDLQTQPLVGSLSAAVAVENGAFVSIGSASVASSNKNTFAVGQVTATKFEFQVTMTANAGLTAGPTLVRTTFRAFPSPARSEQFQVPLLLHEDVLPSGHAERFLDPLAELSFIQGLVHSHEIVTYQEHGVNTFVYVVDYEFRLHHETRNRLAYNGLCVVTLRTIPE